MKIKELIEKLQKLAAKNSNATVIVADFNTGLRSSIKDIDVAINAGGYDHRFIELEVKMARLELDDFV